MIKADLHCHTRYSQDSDAEPTEIIENAISSSVDVLALTDHLDLDFPDYGMVIEIDLKKRKNEILELKERYRKKIKLIYGIELGQPYSYPNEAMKAIEEGGFEFVLGAVHNLKSMPDFYYFAFDKMLREGANAQGMLGNLYTRYLDDVNKLTALPYIDSVAHCTYPYRYMRAAGVDFDMRPYFPKYEEIFKNIVKNGKYLEINTSNIRRGFDFTMPNDDLLQLYRDCGGRFVTIGSDAHRPSEVGADIELGIEKAKKLGFEVITEIKELY